MPSYRRACPHCLTKFQAHTDHAGRKERCQSCGKDYRIAALPSLDNASGTFESDPLSQFAMTPEKLSTLKTSRLRRKTWVGRLTFVAFHAWPPAVTILAAKKLYDAQGNAAVGDVSWQVFGESVAEATYWPTVCLAAMLLLLLLFAVIFKVFRYARDGNRCF